MPSPDWLALQWQLIRPYGRQIYYTLFPSRRPDYFRAPWTYPQNRFPASGSPVCFFLPMTDWHARIQRSQQLAKAIAAAGSQAVYLNPHLGLEYPRPYLLDPQTRVAELAPGLFEMHIHLPREHELNHRSLTGAESSRIAREMARLVETPGIREGALIVSFPAWLQAAEQIRRRFGFPVVYDCHDWLPGFGRTAPALLDAERALLAAADAVVFSSQFLRDRVLAAHPVAGKSVLIRNAADALPSLAVSRADNIPTIGYVGALDHWFDIDAVSAVAAAHPDWRVVLAGRVEDRRVLRLQSYSNVMFLGEVPREKLPALFAGWDAAMIPFLVNDLTLAANPIKLYEYFAAGLPVVSARLPEVEMYGELVYLAGTPQDFAAMCAAAIREQRTELRARRIEAARYETWSARASALLECIRSLRPSA
jgi:glycosyltransferase involved in cell wall biosynthesis